MKRSIAAVALLALIFAGFALPSRATAAAIVPPDQDPFYQPPAGYEAHAPGTVLRTRPVTVTGLGIPLPLTSTQFLVRSTDAHGRPMAVVSTLMVPKLPYLFGKRPLLSYQNAIDSLGDQCNPSFTLRTGTNVELLLMLPSLLKGWAVVNTDYQGPKNAFAAGQLEGRAVLDGIRGAIRLPGTGLAGGATPIGMMGYSGGGLATGWAAELQASYAPELNIKGVASGGTPAEFTRAKRVMDGSRYAGLFIAASLGMSREYPELLTVLNDKGRALAAEMADMCASDVVSRYPNRHLSEFTTMPDAFEEPVVKAVLAENKMGQAPPQAPVYLYHSQYDQLIPIDAGKELHANWCAKGGRVHLYVDYLSDHNLLAATGAPAAILYLDNRFAGQPAPTNC